MNFKYAIVKFRQLVYKLAIEEIKLDISATSSRYHLSSPTVRHHNLLNMQKFVLFAAFVACAAAAPGVLLHQTPVVAVHSPVVHTVPVVGSKTTITKSSQVVSHGSPVVHAVHTPVVATYPVVKSVVTPVVHAPVVHAPVVHAPVVHAVAPVVVKTVPSAVAHSSSVVHHSPIKALPVIAIH
ncbi:unnamed protein product [Pieris brassicae]|uniref:Uncharacterized protein n=2 Tax=Pieris brassicae TaxID=7116 RepID=A0A9P0T678_PIEBR|nr:unnamed protein product [Pieris brassicae]